MRSERALVFLKDYLGDAVMATPLLATLEANYEHINVIAPTFVWEVLTGNVSHAKRLPSKHIEPSAYDIAFVVNRSFRSALQVKRAHIPTRIGHQYEWRGFLLTKTLRYGITDFEAYSYLQLAEAAGLTPVCDKPFLKISEAERERGRELLQDATIILQPGARYAEKQIPLSVSAEVINTLTSQGQKVALVGGPEEKGIATKLQGMLAEPAYDLTGQCTIRETLGVLYAARKVIGADTGVMHIAAAVGTPTVTIFGPTPFEKWAHDYPPHHPIQSPHKSLKEIRAETILEKVC